MEDGIKEIKTAIGLSRIIITSITKIIYLYIRQKKCAFYKSLEQKQKPKKATVWKYRIQRYRNMHNNKVFCI